MSENQITADDEKPDISFKNMNILKSDKEDIVNNIFKIHLDEEIHDLSNEFCKYYYASNIDTHTDCFAIIYDSSFVSPLKTIDFLQKTQVEGLNSILGSSIVKISSTGFEQLVVIVESYDYTNNLLSHVQKKRYYYHCLCRGNY